MVFCHDSMWWMSYDLLCDICVMISMAVSFGKELDCGRVVVVRLPSGICLVQEVVLFLLSIIAKSINRNYN